MLDDEHVEIVNGIYTYNFTVDLTKEITDIKVATSLLMFEQHNVEMMRELFSEPVMTITVDELLAIANKLRLMLLEHENYDSLN